MANQVVWFDLPATDIDRAIKFYSAVLKTEISKQEFDEMAIGVLPHSEEGDVGGCIALSKDVKPSDSGVLIYLNAEGRLDEATAQVEPNGGKILQGKHQIGPYGFRSVILDSEGNRVALHSSK